VPSAGALPIDPQSHVPPGYAAEQRDQPRGFTGDPDIMDTWATSSLTPQIVCGWERDTDLFARTFPMDLRPQGHDIIRTWLFSTLVRSHDEFDSLPWRHAALSGWILDPDRKKMSKSKGNVVVPTDLLHEHGSDAVRYWACSARPGTDTAFDPGQMKIGRRLAMKLLNASKFALGLGAAPAGAEVSEPVDHAMLAQLAALVDAATADFENYDYARALQATEEFFWQFCDDYLELVKDRAYGTGPASASAQTALRTAVCTLLRLFAPFLPYVTEEVWSWGRTDDGVLPGFTDGSVHRAAWPDADQLRALSKAAPSSEPSVLVIAADVLRQIRKAKSDAKRSVRFEVASATVADTADRLAAVRTVLADLKAAGNVTGELALVAVPDGGIPAVDVTLADPEPVAR
jgi:valyl-tRNA synthetase